MDTQKDYYRILGVLDDAEDVVIKAAYRALAQRYHPDKWAGNPNEASARMAEINEAYSVLSNTDKRKEYDKSRSADNYEPDPQDSATNSDGVEVSDCKSQTVKDYSNNFTGVKKFTIVVSILLIGYVIYDMTVANRKFVYHSKQEVTSDIANQPETISSNPEEFENKFKGEWKIVHSDKQGTISVGETLRARGDKRAGPAFALSKNDYLTPQKNAGGGSYNSAQLLWQVNCISKMLFVESITYFFGDTKIKRNEIADKQMVSYDSNILHRELYKEACSN
jgi:hypothetical protein